MARQCAAADASTSAAAAGVRVVSIMNQTGHTSEPSFRLYGRAGSLLLDTAAGGVVF